MGEKHRGLRDLMARSELALEKGMFQESGKLSPSAAYTKALESTADEELAKSCRFAAILHRDYGQEVAQLVAERYTKEVEEMAPKPMFRKGDFVCFTTSAIVVRVVGNDRLAVNNEVWGYVLGEKDGFVHILGQESGVAPAVPDQYDWIRVRATEIVTIRPVPRYHCLQGDPWLGPELLQHYPGHLNRNMYKYYDDQKNEISFGAILGFIARALCPEE